MFDKIDHIGIVVENLDQAIQRFETLYGARCRKIETLSELRVRIAYIPVGNVTLELAEPIASEDSETEGRVAAHLREKGEGFHHIAYRVKDLEASLLQLKTAGVRLRDDQPRPGGEGSRVAFIDPEDTYQVLTELVERGGAPTREDE